MSIRIRFICGHEANVGMDPKTVPTCACGEKQIARTFARAPRFVGACSGPYAEMKYMEPAVVDLTSGGQGSLKLKPTQE